MTRQLDIERLLDLWLDEGPTDTADDVFDSAVARVYRQRQRPAWRFLRREPTMTTTIKFLLAAAAVIVVAVVGGTYLFGERAPVGNVPSPTPSATPLPAPTASPSTVLSGGAEFPSWFPNPGEGGAGIMPAGPQTTQRFLAGSTFTVPDGWVNEADQVSIYALLENSSANEAEYKLSNQVANGFLLVNTPQDNMFVICEETGRFQGTTADDVIDAIVANEALSATEPIDITIGGLTGRQVDVQLSPTWTGSCPLSADDPPTRDYGDSRNRVIMLDIPGRGPIGISIGTLYSSDYEAFLAEAMPILESFEFAVEPIPSPS